MWLSGDDLVVVSLIPGWGDFSFRHIFASHLCRSMWEKESVALERKVVLVLVCEKARKHICVTDRHDITLAVKVALNPNTTNNQSKLYDDKVLKIVAHVCYMVHLLFPFWNFNIDNLDFNMFNPLSDDKFKTLPNWKSLLTTISYLMNMAQSSPNG